MSSKKLKATRKRMISYAPELSRVRGITPANLNTFSNANRTRDPKVMQTFFWTVYDIFRRGEPRFIKGRHHGKLAQFNLRGIYAIDSTTLAFPMVRLS